MKHYPNSVSKALALLMALVMTLSLAVTSAFAVSYQNMNPKDALLGTKFPVDATITLVTDENGKDVSLSIPVSGMTKDALAAAVSAGTVSLSLERDDSRPYVNEELFPYAYAGGDLNSWMIEGKDEPVHGHQADGEREKRQGRARCLLPCEQLLLFHQPQNRRDDTRLQRAPCERQLLHRPLRLL